MHWLTSVIKKQVKDENHAFSRVAYCTSLSLLLGIIIAKYFILLVHFHTNGQCSFVKVLTSNLLLTSTEIKETAPKEVLLQHTVFIFNRYVNLSKVERAFK